MSILRFLLAGLVGIAAVTASHTSAPTPAPTSATHVAGCRTETQSPGTTAVIRIDVDHRQRTFRLSAPAHIDGPAPLIVAFHGRGQDAADIQRYSALSHLDAWVAYPDGVEHDGQRAWEGAPYASDADDVLFTQRVVSAAEQRGCVDIHRIDATGISNGGGFVALLACRIPTEFAAYAAVDGAFYAGTDTDCRGNAVPMLEFHGTADPVIHYDGGHGSGGAYPPISTWLERWASTDHCSGKHTTAVTASVDRVAWTGCAPHATVVHYRIEGGGHTWPGATASSGPGTTNQSISATSIMWRFFEDHPESES